MGKQEVVRRLSSLGVPSTVGTKNESGLEDPANETDVAIDSTTKITCAAATSLALTDEERYDNAAWRMRLMIGSVFSRDYTPKRWERKEMDAIIDFLALKTPNQNDHPEYLVSDGYEICNICFSKATSDTKNLRI